MRGFPRCLENIWGVSKSCSSALVQRFIIEDTGHFEKTWERLPRLPILLSTDFSTLPRQLCMIDIFSDLSWTTSPRFLDLSPCCGWNRVFARRIDNGQDDNEWMIFLVGTHWKAKDANPSGKDVPDTQPIFYNLIRRFCEVSSDVGGRRFKCREDKIWFAIHIATFDDVWV